MGDGLARFRRPLRHDAMYVGGARRRRKLRGAEHHRPPTEMLAELACCITSFFNETGHQKVQRNGAWCEECAGEPILVWEPGDPS